MIDIPPPQQPVNRYFTYEHHGSTDIGRLRNENQDTLLALPDLSFFVVSDGMGGHRGGSIASAIVTNTLPAIVQRKLERLRSSSTHAFRRLLKNAIVELNRHVRQQGQEGNGFPDMGATVTAVLLNDKRAFIANLGDSRAYLFRNNTLRQISRDHSVVGHLLRHGIIQPHQGQMHPAQGELTHYIGMPERPRPFVKTQKLKPADRLVLCTDGLTDMIADTQMAEILAGKADPESAVNALIDAANTAGGHDNITVLLLDVCPC